MLSSNSLFSKLVIILIVVIGLSGASFLVVGLEGFRANQKYIQEQIRRHTLANAAGQVGAFIELGEWERVAPTLQNVRDSAEPDQASLAFISEILRELDSPAGDRNSLRSLADAWHVYQLNEVYRLVDDLKSLFRSLLLKAGTTWLVFSLLFMVIGRKMYLYGVRPVRYLTQYFRAMDLSREVTPLFVDSEARRRSGVDDAAVEVQELFRGTEALVSRVRDFRSINIHRLVEQKARAEVLASASRDAVYFLRDTRVVWCNRLGAELLGLASRSATLPVDLALCSSSRQESLVRAILGARKKDTPVEWRVQDKEDPGEIQAFLFTQNNADWRHWGEQLDFDSVVVGQDVSWIRQAEDAKTHFIGLLSHEVKTPVTSLLMATRLLQRSSSSLNAVQKKLVDSSVRDVERLRELIDELFAASRFELDAEKLNFRVVDLRRLLSQSVRSTRAEAEARGVSMDLAFRCSELEVMARADAPRISWSLMQLITYLLRHSPRNSRIEVRMSEAMIDSNHALRIVVRSVGSPAMAGLTERIFQRNFAHYDLRVARSNSTGMSLAIAREIAMGHGGTLALNSDYRDGAEFILTLPQGRAGIFEERGGRNGEVVGGG
jgi:signal transduction histidine kinase